MEQQPQLTFRISPWRPWLLALAPLALLAAIGVAFSVVAGQLATAAGILLGFAALALALLPIGLAARVSRWHVAPDGIGGPNHWLAYHRLDWSDIESVEPWLLPGYRYVQVNGVGRRWAFWLPLFLTDMLGLRAAVARYAPPDNPLRRYLEHHPA